MTKLIKILIIFFCFYQITACATLFVSVSPVKMYEGQVKKPEEISIIAGHNYRITPSCWHQVFITRVDEKNVTNELDLKSKHIVTVLPGEHEIQLQFSIGTQIHNIRNRYSPSLMVNVQKGRAYQICYTNEMDENLGIVGRYPVIQQAYLICSNINISNMRDFVFIYMKDVGTVQDYLKYLETENAKDGTLYKKCDDY